MAPAERSVRPLFLEVKDTERKPLRGRERRSPIPTGRGHASSLGQEPVAPGTAGLRKRRSRVSEGDVEDSAPLWDKYIKIGEGGLVLGGNNWAARGAGSEEWGEALTSERGAGLAREPGRTPQGGNARKLERPKDYEASPH